MRITLEKMRNIVVVVLEAVKKPIKAVWRVTKRVCVGTFKFIGEMS